MADLDALAAKTKARLEAKRKEREEAERIDALAKEAYKRELEGKTGSEFVEPEPMPEVVVEASRVGDDSSAGSGVSTSGASGGGKKKRMCEECQVEAAVAKVTLSDGSILKACQGCIDALADGGGGGGGGGGDEEEEMPPPPADEPLEVRTPARKPPMAGAVNIFGGMGLGGAPVLKSTGRGGGMGGPGRGRGGGPGPGRGRGGAPGRGPMRGGPGRGRVGPGRVPGRPMMGGGGGPPPNKALLDRISSLEAKIKEAEERADQSAALLDKLLAQLA
jgi:hypothetical protein